MRLILALLLAEVLNLNSVPGTLDNCATDTECEIAAARHCAAGDVEFCEVAK